MVEGIVVTIVAGLLSAVGYFFMQWVSEVEKQLEHLEDTVRRLDNDVDELKKYTVRTSDCLARSGELKRSIDVVRYRNPHH